MFIEQAINKALDFHEMIGNERKEKRLHYLKNYWFDKVKNCSQSKTAYFPSLRNGAVLLAMFQLKEKSPKNLIAFCLINIKYIQLALTGKTYTVFVSLQMFILQQRI
jgi:selenocysteine lyase/cysteine desulfurase